MSLISLLNGISIHLCSILLLGLDKQQGTCTYKNIILYSYSSMVKLVWSSRAIRERERESSHTQRSNPHAMLVFHWPWFTPTQCLLFIGHSLHPCNACFSLAMIFTHAILVLHWSQLTPTHSLFLVIILLILSVNNIWWVHHRSRWYIILVEEQVILFNP